MKPLTQEEEAELARLIGAEVQAKPPTIRLVGVSGVGKSSTVNATFKTRLPVSHTVACTKVTHGPSLSTEELDIVEAWVKQEKTQRLRMIESSLRSKG